MRRSHTIAHELSVMSPGVFLGALCSAFLIKNHVSLLLEAAVGALLKVLVFVLTN